METVTLEFAKNVIEEETGVPLELPAETEAPDAAAATNGNGQNGELKLVARDEKKTPLLSALAWTPEAVERLFRVPSGYLRDKTQERTEKLASEQGVEQIDVGLVDAGIDVGRRLMEELLEGMKQAEAAASAGNGEGQPAEATPPSKCPMSGMSFHVTAKPNGKNGDAGKLYLNEVGLMSALEDKRKS